MHIAPTPACTVLTNIPWKKDLNGQLQSWGYCNKWTWFSVKREGFKPLYVLFADISIWPCGAKCSLLLSSPLCFNNIFPTIWCYSECADYSQSESVPVNVHISELLFATWADSDIFLNMSEKQGCHTPYFI